MISSEIIDFLEECGLSEIEEVKSEDSSLILKCFYDFDNEEISSAKAYANEESDLEEESDEWYTDWYIPYLTELANDNVEEYIEEACDEFEVGAKFKSKINSKDAGYIEYYIAITDDEEIEELEEILNDYV